MTGDDPPAPGRDEMICAHYIYDPEDMETRIKDWNGGRHSISIGKQFSVRIIGTLDELALIGTMIKSLAEREMSKDRIPPGFEEERRRAEEG